MAGSPNLNRHANCAPLCYRRALSFIPSDFFSGDVGKVDHMAGGGGTVADFGVFSALFPGADAFKELSHVQRGRVSAILRLNLLGWRSFSGCLLAAVADVHELFL